MDTYLVSYVIHSGWLTSEKIEHQRPRCITKHSPASREISILKVGSGGRDGWNLLGEQFSISNGEMLGMKIPPWN